MTKSIKKKPQSPEVNVGDKPQEEPTKILAMDFEPPPLPEVVHGGEGEQPEQPQGQAAPAPEGQPTPSSAQEGGQSEPQVPEQPEQPQELTPEETADLQRLEQQFSRGQRESIAALREIRERRLYRQTHESFDDYIEERWNHTRQWATQQINWLRRTELLETNGNVRYHLTVDDCKALGVLEDYPEEFVRTVAQAEEQARRVNKPRTKKMLEAAVKDQLGYIRRRNDTEEDLTWDEHLVLQSLGDTRQSSPNLVEQARQQSEHEAKPLVECLAETCAEKHSFPTDSHLLSVARGDALAELVRPLVALRAKWTEERESQKRESELQAELEKVKRQRLASKETPADQASGDHDEEPGAERHEGPAAEQPPEEEENAIQEYEVQLTGDFAQWMGETKTFLTRGDIVDLLFSLSQEVEADGELGEASITIRPMAPLDDDGSEKAESDQALTTDAATDTAENR